MSTPHLPPEAAQPVAQYHCTCGEGPLYDPARNCVFWTDIDTGRLFRIDCDTHAHRQIYTGDPVGGFTLQTDGRLLLFRVRDIALLDPDSGSVQKVMDFHDDGSVRFNDTSAGPDGACYAGTIGKTATSGGLFKLTPDRQLSLLFRGTGCANGMGWSPDRRTMYWTCSTRNTIFAYDFDPDAGTLANERVFHQVHDRKAFGTCDGLTVAADGTVFSARWDGHGIYTYAPDGTPLQFIRLPVAKVTSMCFAGRDLRDLYITTAGRNESPDGLAGALFRVRVPQTGQLDFRSRIAV
ncbi:MAG: SMP-30/gluconolactonase/LRE family protein [Tepidisphaerales bacterium]